MSRSTLTSTTSTTNNRFPQLNDENARPTVNNIKLNNNTNSNSLTNNILKPLLNRSNTTNSNNTGVINNNLLTSTASTTAGLLAKRASRVALGDISNKSRPIQVYQDSKSNNTTATTANTSSSIVQQRPIIQSLLTKKPNPVIVQNNIAPAAAVSAPITVTVTNNNNLLLPRAQLASLRIQDDKPPQPQQQQSHSVLLSPVIDEDSASAAVDMSCTISPAVNTNTNTIVDTVELNANRALDAHLYASDYIDDIYQYLTSIENRYRANSNYMSTQIDINSKMREILIDWLHEVHNRFRLQTETLYLTINIIDRYLELNQFNRKKLQLIGCCSMLLASKYEEIFVPEVADFVQISDRAYSKEEILEYEQKILAALEFNFTICTSWRFIERYILHIQQAINNSNNHSNNNNSNNANKEFIDKLKHYSNYLLQSTLQHYSFLKYSPSILAAAALVIGLNTLYNSTNHSNITNIWINEFQLNLITNYSIIQLKDCIVELISMIDNNTNNTSTSNKYNSVERKFLKPKYLEVAKIRINKNNLF